MFRSLSMFQAMNCLLEIVSQSSGKVTPVGTTITQRSFLFVPPSYFPRDYANEDQKHNFLCSRLFSRNQDDSGMKMYLNPQDDTDKPERQSKTKSGLFKV